MYTYKPERCRIPIKVWSEQGSIEAGALEQIENAASLPFAFHHAVAAADCLTEDTEILTKSGFRFIKDIDKNIEIANVNIYKNNMVFFKKPKDVIIRNLKNGETIHSYFISPLEKYINVTNKHRMPYKKDLGIISDDIPEISTMRDYLWSGNGLDIDNEYEILDDELSLIAWIVGDGNIRKNIQKSGRVSSQSLRWVLKKERKIKRVCDVLKSLLIPYNIRTTGHQTSIELSVDNSKKYIGMVGENKEYPNNFIYSLSKRQAIILLNEMIEVDGDFSNFIKYGNKKYNTKRKIDVDFISALIAINVGIANSNDRISTGFGYLSKMNYISLVTSQETIESNCGLHYGRITKKEIKYTGKVVCVTCETGFFIARQNGITFVTGNCHQGYGAPIGGVIATKGIIIPDFVGKDIGCGVCAVRTSLTEIDKETLKVIMGKIRKVIPLGFDHQEKEQSEGLMPMISEGGWICKREYKSALKQLGTLGGGNHFIEIQKGSDSNIWIMLHSGSRNLGSKVADHYNNIAVKLNEKWCSSVPKQWDLAFLPMDSREGREYFNEMNYCVEFAHANRKLMVDRILDIFLEVTDSTWTWFDKQWGIIDIFHNYAAWENHFGENVIVHRKGATRARTGEIGIIPGSMGTNSYIVKGLGNPESFMSCSHGAGRVMGRIAAKKNLNLVNEIKNLDDQGIVHGIRNIEDLDEAPSAYKDIHVVMNNQKDLVEIMVELTPLGVIKG